MRIGKTALALAVAGAVAGSIGFTPRAHAFLDDILTAPKTLIDRAIEARSSKDIIKDNEIVIDVNAIMVDMETIKASTEIYEQRLLVTGMFDDQAMYDEFRARVEKVEGVKELYWHVHYMSEEEQEARDDELLDWTDALALDAKVGVGLIGTAGVADVNMRVATDAFATVYLIGRARSEEELKKALTVARETEGTREVVNYIEVRP